MHQGILFPTIISGSMRLPKDIPGKLFDVTGREVDAAQLAPGIYFIEIDGKITQKIIKVR
jgi:hypothetical protein